jgi:hypothetical protein
MSDKKTITIRFSQSSPSDMELYQLLEQDAGCSISLAAVVKNRLKQSYDSKEQNREDTDFQEQLITVIREEMQKSCMKIIGGLLSCRNDADNMMHTKAEAGENVLPEKSADLPNGALDFLNH